MATLAVIPARGGSKRLPRKNLVALAGKPLIAHTIEAALRCDRIDRVVVSTEDEAIACVARQWGVEVVERPAELATDEAILAPVCRHALLEMERRDSRQYDIHVLLQPTSPLRTAEHIRAGIEMLRKRECDSVVSVRMSREAPHRARIIVNGQLRFLITPGEHGTISTQEDIPQTYYPNGALYITYRKILLDRGDVYGDRAAPLIMSPEESVDIDTLIDLKVAQALLRWRADCAELRT